MLGPVPIRWTVPWQRARQRRQRACAIRTYFLQNSLYRPVGHTNGILTLLCRPLVFKPPTWGWVIHATRRPTDAARQPTNATSVARTGDYVTALFGSRSIAARPNEQWTFLGSCADVRRTADEFNHDDVTPWNRRDDNTSYSSSQQYGSMLGYIRVDTTQRGSQRDFWRNVILIVDLRHWIDSPDMFAATDDRAWMCEHQLFHSAYSVYQDIRAVPCSPSQTRYFTNAALTLGLLPGWSAGPLV